MKVYGIEILSKSQIDIADDMSDLKAEYLEAKQKELGSDFDELAETNVFYMIKLSEYELRLSHIESIVGRYQFYCSEHSDRKQARCMNQCQFCASV
jgi:hypothetical protein